MQDNFDLIEPLKYYHGFLKGAFDDLVRKRFNDLVDESKIDIDANQFLVDKYKQASNSKDSIAKQAKKLKIGRTIVIVFEVMFALFTFSVFSEGSIGSGILCGLIFAGLMALHFMYLKPKIKNHEDIINKYENHMTQLKQQCYESLAPLNALFTSEMTTDMIREVVPILNIDDNFDIRRFEQLVKNYNFAEGQDDNYSTLNLVSGDILGNPFVFIKNLTHRIVDHEYEGTRTVSYTVYYTDSDGHRRSRTETETLHAYVTKPRPDYNDQILLVYGNEAAPNLTFYREPRKENAGEGFMNKFFQKDKKKLKKLSEKSIKEGGTFQAMANEDFEIAFQAYDRNNESEFRLLFTSLAQRNMMDFLHNETYGDDLYFNKDQMINWIYCTHTDAWNIDNHPSSYMDYDFVSCRNNFFNLNQKYFQDMFYTFIPLLSIPLYQQHKALEYIYGNSYAYNYNSYTTEMVANAMDVANFNPQDASPLAKTILKTSTISSQGDTDFVKVEAHTYATFRRVDVVAVRAGNGRYYDVQVPWIEYIPRTKVSTMEVTGAGMDESSFNKLKYDRGFNDDIKNYSLDYAYKDRLFGTLTNQNAMTFASNIKNLLKK